GDETFNMVVSYTSMVIRWWQVSLTSCRQQAHIVLTFAVNNLTAIHRPLQSPKSPERVPPSPQAEKRGTVVSKPGHRMVESRDFLRVPGKSPRRPSAASSSKGSVVSKGSKASRLSPALESLRSPVRTPREVRSPTASVRVGDAFLPSSDRHGRLRSPVQAEAGDEAGDSASLLIVASDSTGAMPFFQFENEKITRVYTCIDEASSPDTEVDQIFCLEQGIAVLLRSGDVRHFEFQLDQDTLRLADLPLS
ncbi:unnamed protein product, partial [Polarella glacialis]